MLFRPQGLIPERVRRLEIPEEAEPRKRPEGKKEDSAEAEKEEAVT
jgi:hypothetical protein